MRIVVKNNGGPNIRLSIPSGLVLNRFASGFVQGFLKELGLDITKEQAIIFIKELNRYRQNHPKWVLVEVQSSSGEYVFIKL